MKKHLCSCIVILLLLAPTASFSLTGIDEMALFEMDLGQLGLQAAQLQSRLDKDIKEEFDRMQSDKELSEAQRQHLRSMGIEPD